MLLPQRPAPFILDRIQVHVEMNLDNSMLQIIVCYSQNYLANTIILTRVTFQIEWKCDFYYFDIFLGVAVSCVKEVTILNITFKLHHHLC